MVPLQLLTATPLDVTPLDVSLESEISVFSVLVLNWYYLFISLWLLLSATDVH